MSKPLVHSRGLTKSAGACRVTPADHRATNAGRASRGRHARLYCMAAATATDPTGRRLHPAADARCSPPASSHVAPTTLPDTVVATQGACSRAREAPATTATAAASSLDQSSAARADDLRREMVPSPASARPRCHSGARGTERERESARRASYPRQGSRLESPLSTQTRLPIPPQVAATHLAPSTSAQRWQDHADQPIHVDTHKQRVPHTCVHVSEGGAGDRGGEGAPPCVRTAQRRHGGTKKIKKHTLGDRRCAFV